MHIVDLPLDQLMEAPWNPNGMDDAMQDRLAFSVDRYGLVVPLVVRPLNGGDIYEVLSGNQRLAVLQALDHETAPCVVVEVDDAHARLLAQALNQVHGDDDLGLRAELVRTVLQHVPEYAVLSLLPETSESLQALAGLGQTDVAGHLEAWQAAQAARLRHLMFQLVPSQQEIVERALDRAAERVGSGEENPNKRGNALYAICRVYLEAAHD